MSTMEGILKHEEEEEGKLRRGPWTVEEDDLLMQYIAFHGEGRWNLLAKSSGLKRTGKSCRLRWLNYLKPDVKRGNLTPEEQILILELHSKWGNRWSRIAQHLPGRTDNEIKNYWRTRVQRQAKQLKIDANSTLFRDTIRRLWMPRLVVESSASSLRSHESTNMEHNQMSIPTSPAPMAPPVYGMADGQQQPHLLPHEVATIIPYGLLQLPDCRSSSSCQFPTTFDGCGHLVETQSPIQEIDAGPCDLTSDGSTSVGTDGFSRPWDSMDELWQVLTTTRT